MISSEKFIDYLNQQGFGPFFGVPCSFLKPFINYVIDRDDLDYITANNEGEAIAMAAGAYLAGKKPVVMFQNSGLGNAVNPLTSLAHTYRIPMLLIVTRRGDPGLKGEPQHELMGRITLDLLQLMQVEHASFPQTDEQVEAQLQLAIRHMEATGLPYAFIMPKGAVEAYALQSVPPANKPSATSRQPDATETLPANTPPPSRTEALTAVLEQINEDMPVIASTGKTGRELFELTDRSNHFYMVGSMGCASSIGLGLALYQPDKPVIVLDGDGAALMRLEAMVSIGHHQPPQFIHIILDNQVHDSTGGQATLSPGVSFPAMALACGYRTAVSLTTSEALGDALISALTTPGPHLLHLQIRAGSPSGLGRPTLTPPVMAARFRRQVSGL